MTERGISFLFDCSISLQANRIGQFLVFIRESSTDSYDEP